MPLDTRPALRIQGEVIDAVSAAYRDGQQLVEWFSHSVTYEMA